MKRQPLHIRLTALLLLAVFTLGSAPKSWFHDLLATHRDMVPCTTVHHKAVMHQQGFSCHCQDLVVTSHFILWPDVIPVMVPVPRLQQKSSLLQQVFAGAPFHSNYRGPPSS